MLPNELGGAALKIELLIDVELTTLLITINYKYYKYIL